MNDQKRRKREEVRKGRRDGNESENGKRQSEKRWNEYRDGVMENRDGAMEISGVETGGVVAPPCAAAAGLPPVQCQELLASWRRQHGSLVRFVDARVVYQSLYSLI